MEYQREKLVFTKKDIYEESIKPDLSRFGRARKEESSVGELETTW